MLPTTLLFWITFGLLFWAYCGYIITLLILHHFFKRKQVPLPMMNGYPEMAVIIPFFNEASYIQQKVDNCKKLLYKGKLSVYFVDGMSTDASAEIVKRSIQGLEGFLYIESQCKGKIHQMNHLLKCLDRTTEIIVCSDADTAISADTLIKIAEAFATDRQLGVVGAAVEPGKNLCLESQYWRDQNLIRFLESETGHTSMVCAPCYAFRAGLLSSFPCSCVADDVYITFYANGAGYKTQYLNTIKCIELRTPGSLRQFFIHKFRKGNAYLRELYRFMPKVAKMQGWWKIIFITRTIQLTLIAWLIPAYLFCALYFILYCQWVLVLWSSAVFVAGLSCASIGLKSFGVSISKNKADSCGMSIFPFFVVNLVLIALAFSYPFTKQTSCYKKLKNCIKRKRRGKIN
jgi:cellulose synthase/poly-beta-1,6-N-acetylglucosamine synthase-like glycosyltransferase